MDNINKNELRNVDVDWGKLDDFMSQYKAYVERAECTIQDIAETYFEIPNEKLVQENYWSIIAGYKTAGIKAQIVIDYLFNLRKLGQEIENFIDVLFNEYEKYVNIT